jgi:hypothetical protein
LKTALLTSLFLVIAHFGVQAQHRVPRNIQIKHIDRDSVHIPMSSNYLLTEDNCAQITRQSRYNYQQKTFYGNFTDVNPANTTQILGSGAYTAYGLKTGPFELRYPNGKLRATGRFADDKFTGDWSVYFENGNPKLKFTVKDGSLLIQEAWDESGKQIVTNGNGKYEVRASILTWSGELLNGKPEGTWRSVNPLDRSKVVYLTEKFKDGKFIKGNGITGPYTDESRILWFDNKEFPFLNIEKFIVTSEPCGSTIKHGLVIGAHYRNGLGSFSDEIGRKISKALTGVNIKPYDNELTFEGEVNENGRISNLSYKNAFNERIASSIARELKTLPLLEPATLDGKPIKQKFEINFKINPQGYTFNYRFLPIDLQSI